MCIWLLVLLFSGNVKENDLIYIDLSIRAAGILLGAISLYAFLIKIEFNIYSIWSAWSWPEIVLGLITGIIFIL